MVHTRYTLEIINGIVGAIRALLRGRVFVRWFEKGYRSRRGGSGVEKGGDACVAQRARTSACRQDTSWPGRRKRPHSTQHRPRPYADNERDMARHVAAQKLTAVSNPRRRPENLTITRTAHSDDQ